jgi:hypothetical protein
MITMNQSFLPVEVSKPNLLLNPPSDPTATKARLKELGLSSDL